LIIASALTFDSWGFRRFAGLLDLFDLLTFLAASAGAIRFVDNLGVRVMG